MSLSLPDRPNLEQLRKQAKDLLKSHKRGEASVCRILRHLSRFRASSDEEVLKSGLSLSEAQHALAREYGFKNWATLARRVRTSPPPGQGWNYSGTTPVIQMEKSGTFRMVMSRTGRVCRCELCDKPATTHVTDKTAGKLVERHYCATHGWEKLVMPARGHIAHLNTAPVKYAVTVSLTQEQVERQEAVRVTLPDGCVAQAQFPADAPDGLIVLASLETGASESYFVRFVLHVIPPPAQR